MRNRLNDWGDTLINSHFGDCYFSRENGLAESEHVFVAGNGLPESVQGRTSIHIGETGFGTGLNLLATLRALANQEQPLSLHWWSVEKFPLTEPAITAGLGLFAPLRSLLPNYLEMYHSLQSENAAGWRHGRMKHEKVSVELHVWFGDVLDMLADLPHAIKVIVLKKRAMDAWILDGHSPALNPDMWSPKVFAGVADNSRTADPETDQPATTLASYTAAGQVKQGLRAVGFTIVRRPGHGSKRHMIQGRFDDPVGTTAP